MGDETIKIEGIAGRSHARQEFWKSQWSDRVEWLAALWLWCRRGFTIHHLKSVIQKGEVVGVVRGDDPSVRSLLESAGVAPGLCGRILQKRPDSIGSLERWGEDIRRAAGMSTIAIGEDAYPGRLYDLEEPPGFLFVAGDIEYLYRGVPAATLSVVGSRDIPAGTQDWVRPLVGGVARRGVIIVSGGALGADAMAHRAAMDVGVPTISVMPCGLDSPKPKTNGPMFRRIIEQGGALVGEYPPGTSVRSYHYPRRNRLIAALGDATLVLRAGLDSGTLLTAEAAESIERPLGAVPGRPGDRLVEGCHSLLAGEAVPVARVSDAFERLLDRSTPEDGHESSEEGEQMPVRQSRMRWPDTLSESAETLLDVAIESLGSSKDDFQHEVTVDELSRCCDVPASQVQSALLEWELVGLVDRSGGQQSVTLRVPVRDGE